MTVRVKVEGKLVPGLAEALGGQSIDVELADDAADLKQLLAELGGRGPKVAEALFDRDGGLEPHLIILVNGERHARKDALEEERLQDGDSVMFMILIGGG